MDREARTLLLVDGSASMLFYLGTLLKRFGYRVETSGSAEEALLLMTDRKPCVVVCDAAVPKMGGSELLMRMKGSQALAAIPLVMLSTGEDPALEETYRRLGCAAHLVKPVDPDHLYATIQQASECVPRTHIRLRTSLKVIIGDGTAIGGAARTEFATALSEGGMYVQTRYPQPRNALTPVCIFLPAQTITAKAVVLYSGADADGAGNETGMGMKFVEISDRDRDSIRNYIRQEVTQGMQPEK